MGLKIIGHATIFCLMLMCGPLMASPDQNQRVVLSDSPPTYLLTGKVRSSSGEPMAGVTISAKVSGAPVSVSVFTDEEGAYYFPPLNESGRYIVTAQAIGYSSAPAEIDINNGVARADFTLKTTDNVFPQMSGWQQAMALPEETREQRRGKAILLKSCSNCHQTSKIFSERFDEGGWQHIITAMAKWMSMSREPRPNIMEHKAEFAAYLNNMIGPQAPPLKPEIPPRPSGDALLPVIYEYSIPNRMGGYPFENGSDWSKGPPIVSGTDTGIHDATVDFAGNLWFSNPRPMPGRTIGKIDGVTGKTTSFNYAGEKEFSTGRSHAIITAEDGTVWFTLAYGPSILKSHLGFVDPASGEQKVYEVPEGMADIGGWLNDGGLGNIWAAAGDYSGSEGVLRFDRKTQKFQQYKSISPGMTYGAAGDAKGNGWWAQIDKDIIGHVDIKTGEVSEIRLPFTWQGAPFLKPGDFSKEEYQYISIGVSTPGGASQMPRRLKADLKGEHVWIANYSGNNVLRININTFEQTYYPLPEPGMGPYDVDIDKEHNVWVGLQNGDEVARLNPPTGEWVIYTLPSKGISPRSLMVVERDGRTEVILPENDTSKVCRLIVRTAEDMDKLKNKYTSFKDGD